MARIIVPLSTHRRLTPLSICSGDIVLCSTSAPSPTSSPAASSASHSHVTCSAPTTGSIHSAPLRLILSNFAAYTVVSIQPAADAAACLGKPESSGADVDAATAGAAADRTNRAAAAGTAAPAAADAVRDFVVCQSNTRVIVTGGGKGAGLERVWLPAWSRMWQSMLPVPVALMTADTWPMIHRLSRELQVDAAPLSCWVIPCVISLCAVLT